MLHVGMDMHKRKTEVVVLDDDGNEVDRRELNHDDREKMIAYLEAIGADGVAAVEATRSWYWFVEMLEECGLKVKLAHPLRVRLKPDPRAESLMSAPGIGHLSACLLLAEIGDIGRFPSDKKLCAYSGLVPGTYQSGEHCWSGAITKQGNRYIRWTMIEAAQKATEKDPALGYFYEKLKRSKGAAKARVAVARKLLVAVYHILKYNERYRYNSLANIHLGKPVLRVGHPG